MKSKLLLIMALSSMASSAAAAPEFWQPRGTQTPVPPLVPIVEQMDEPSTYQTATPTPVTAPEVGIPTATPTREPGLSAKDPTEAALLSAVIPGSGLVYAGDPAKGVVFAALFGVGLWQTLDNLQLVPDSGATLKAKNETMGSLWGLATLAAYGFGIQDALNTAVEYNKRHYLVLQFGITPRPGARLAYMF